MFDQWKMQKQAEEELYNLLAKTLDAQAHQWKHSGRDINRGYGDGCKAAVKFSEAEKRKVENHVHQAAREVVKIQTDTGKKDRAATASIVNAASEYVLNSSRPSDIAASLRNAIKLLRENHSENYEHIIWERALSSIDVHAERVRNWDDLCQSMLNSGVMMLE